MKINLSNNTKKFISEKMFGLFFEDINYAADGGLYAEMIENRQFSFRRSWAGSATNDYQTEYTPGYGWNIYGQQNSAEMEFIFRIRRFPYTCRQAVPFPGRLQSP